jgi:hypothetical protein
MSSSNVTTQTPWQLYASTYPHDTRWSDLLQVFLSEQNIKWVVDQIELQLTMSQNQPVSLQVSLEWANQIVDLAYTNRSIASTQSNLQALNTTIIDKEVRTQRTSFNHSQRFQKYFVENDRFHVMPRPRLADEGAKWTGDATQHVLTHPMSKQSAAYHAFVYGKH